MIFSWYMTLPQSAQKIRPENKPACFRSPDGSVGRFLSVGTPVYPALRFTPYAFRFRPSSLPAAGNAPARTADAVFFPSAFTVL